MNTPYPIIWAGVMLVLFMLEAVSFNLVTIWFAFGAMLAWIASLMGFAFEYQMIIFVGSSVGLLYFTKPIAKKYLKVKQEKTNSDRIIGQHGTVIEYIDAITGKGQIKVIGQIWSAKSVDKKDIEIGTSIIVEDIEGVKAVVRVVD